jgi:hypothetical protein
MIRNFDIHLSVTPTGMFHIKAAPNVHICDYIQTVHTINTQLKTNTHNSWVKTQFVKQTHHQ